MRGGGGGSGGRVVVNFLRAFMKSSYPDQSFFWRGKLALEGGTGGSLAGYPE